MDNHLRRGVPTSISHQVGRVLAHHAHQTHQAEPSALYSVIATRAAAPSDVLESFEERIYLYCELRRSGLSRGTGIKFLPTVASVSVYLAHVPDEQAPQ